MAASGTQVASASLVEAYVRGHEGSGTGALFGAGFGAACRSSTGFQPGGSRGAPSSSLVGGLLSPGRALRSGKDSTSSARVPRESAATRLEGTWAPPLARRLASEAGSAASARGQSTKPPRLCAAMSARLSSSRERARSLHSVVGGMAVSLLLKEAGSGSLCDTQSVAMRHGGDCGSSSASAVAAREYAAGGATMQMRNSFCGRDGGGASNVSHATTPSWRSRSFPPRCPAGVTAVTTIPEDSEAESGEAKPRLPPLPMEARWKSAGMHRRGAPMSEIRRLEEIGSEVCEANAMLVESFLNVKRRAAAMKEEGGDVESFEEASVVGHSWVS